MLGNVQNWKEMKGKLFYYKISLETKSLYVAGLARMPKMRLISEPMEFLLRNTSRNKTLPLLLEPGHKYYIMDYGITML